jgi:hypothetical protein
MSAYMAEDTTINTILNWLRRDIDRLSLISDKLKKIGIDTGIPGWEEILGHEMFQLNIKAVAIRYGSGEAAKFRTLDYRFAQTEAVPLRQVKACLECWLYQCCEGAVRESALYGLFGSDVRLHLMRKIIAGSPEDEEAEEG